MPRIQYPNVPKDPGVPQVNRLANALPTPPPAAVGALGLARLALAFLAKPVWGIYPDRSTDDLGTSDDIDPETGKPFPQVEVNGTPDPPVVVPDSFLTFGYKNEWSVTDAPVERGAFASYNKVANPFEIQLRMFKSGTVNARKAFLDSIEAIAGDLKLYKIVTPEHTYERVNIVRFEVLREEERGAYQLNAVDLYFREIRVVQAEYTNAAADTSAAQQPSARETINVGNVNAQTPAGAPATAASNYIAGGPPP